MRIINSWQQVSLQQFTELVKIQKEQDDAEMFAASAVNVLYGVDAMQIPYTDYLAAVHGLQDFFCKPINEYTVSSDATYKLNGTTYVLTINPSTFTTAQYIDFTTYAQKGLYVDMISAVLIPEGHKYNDGYNMERLRKDVGLLPVSAAFGIISFFVKWSSASTKTILRYLTRRATRMVPREKRVTLRKNLKQLCKLMESSPTY